MDPYKLAEKSMTMDEAGWARHSSPWSVAFRTTCLPLISLACWLRGPLGWWFVLPLAAALFWTWYNPRAFSAPASTDNWASRGTFGERIFLLRHELSIPRHHLVMAHLLTLASAAGIPVLLYGVLYLDALAIILANVLVILSKLWFVDRMNWLYADMKDSRPEFASWLET